MLQPEQQHLHGSSHPRPVHQQDDPEPDQKNRGEEGLKETEGREHDSDDVFRE